LFLVLVGRRVFKQRYQGEINSPKEE
jgi:hypothetical protein